MLDWLGAIFDAVAWIADWLAGENGGIYDLLVEWTAWFLEKLAIWWIQMKAFVVLFAWDVAKQILQDLGITGMLSTVWAQLPEKPRLMAVMLKVPEAVNIVLSAGVTKMVLRLVGW